MASDARNRERGAIEVLRCASADAHLELRKSSVFWRFLTWVRKCRGEKVAGTRATVGNSGSRADDPLKIAVTVGQRGCCETTPAQWITLAGIKGWGFRQPTLLFVVVSLVRSNETEAIEMTTVGSFEAKTRLPQLLERVVRGEKILITRHGKPAAMLVPAPADETTDVQDVIQQMKALRKGNVLGKGMSIRDLIDEGR
jgi:prevent-host-death family protein